MKRIVYREWRLAPAALLGLLASLAAVAGIGGLAFWYMEHQGHWVTGMNNEVVWGIPISLPSSSSSPPPAPSTSPSIGTVFGKPTYQAPGPLLRPFGGGAADRGAHGTGPRSGSPRSADRGHDQLQLSLHLCLEHHSLFGLRGHRRRLFGDHGGSQGRAVHRPAGIFAFVWRLLLTTGTGSIFGFIVARQAFDTAVLAPMFIVMSFLYGLAIFMLVLMFAFAQDQRPIGPYIIKRLKGLMGIFIAAVLLFILIYFLTKLYGAKNYDLVSSIWSAVAAIPWPSGLAG